MRILAIILVSVAIIAALGYTLTSRPQPYRYRMVVEVDTPAGQRFGAVVRELTYVPQSGSFTGNRFTSQQRGDAVAVDLPDGQTLYALLDASGWETPLAGFGAASTLELKPALDRAREDRRTYVLPDRDVLRARNLDYPRLVRFRDPADPRSVEEVDPDDLAASFGAGVRLRRITLQMTDEPVSQSLPARLTWLGTYPEPRLDPDFRVGSNPDIAQRLSHGDFHRGS